MIGLGIEEDREEKGYELNSGEEDWTTPELDTAKSLESLDLRMQLLTELTPIIVGLIEEEGQFD